MKCILFYLALAIKLVDSDGVDVKETRKIWLLTSDYIFKIHQQCAYTILLEPESLWIFLVVLSCTDAKINWR